jgi:NAD(P)-dependent dehydrogenase (short-subunit alcohol dehydrogenase family)
VGAWVEEAADAFGGVDIVYANAGAVRFGAVGTRSRADFSFTPRAALDSVRLTVRAAWPHLVRGRGRVLTVGPTGLPAHRRTARSASEGAVLSLTRRLAAEGAPYGIRVHCVSPGTGLGTPDDVADAAVHLASDEASEVTGAGLVVDGGRPSVLPGPTI